MMTLLSSSLPKVLLIEHIRIHMMMPLSSPTATLVLKHVLPAIILRPQLLVGQHLVRLRDVLEHFLRLLLIVRVFVWMPLERQLSVALLDFFLLGSSRHIQYFVVILFFALFQCRLRLIDLFFAFPLFVLGRNIECFSIRIDRLLIFLRRQLRLAESMQTLHALLIVHVLLRFFNSLFVLLQCNMCLDHFQQRRPDEGKECQVEVHGFPPSVDGIMVFTLFECFVSPFVFLCYFLQKFVSIFATFVFRIQLQTLPKMLYRHIHFIQSKICLSPQLIGFDMFGIILKHFACVRYHPVVICRVEFRLRLHEQHIRSVKRNTQHPVKMINSTRPILLLIRLIRHHNHLRTLSRLPRSIHSLLLLLLSLRTLVRQPIFHQCLLAPSQIHQYLRLLNPPIGLFSV
mmetsp:Transcript_14110/g.30156  ORF Transcript_14110/g.30156 Transcript_14110/m.30156 type:complete len:400 (+) Transcript_14110:193-1392(+)